MTVFTTLQGTSETSFRVGLTGPTIYTGSADPTVTPPTPLADGFRDGDIYFRGATGLAGIWVIDGGTWAQVVSGVGVDINDLSNVNAAGATDLQVLTFDNGSGDWIASGTSFTTADRIKLDGVEALANVTDTANVTAAGALMDSEVTNLSGIKTLTVPDSTTISAFGASLVDDINQATAQTTLGVDPAGTDNSIDVTLIGTPDYITIAGQIITRGLIDLTTDVTGVLPIANFTTGTADGTKFVGDDGILQSIALDDLSNVVADSAIDDQLLTFGIVTSTANANVGGDNATPRDIFFKPDGLKVFMIGSTATASIFEYVLLTAFDLSSIQASISNSSVAGENLLPQDLFFKPDGTKVFVIGSTAPASIFEYTLSTPWLLSSIQPVTSNFSLTSQDTSPVGLSFKPDGTKFFVLGSSGDSIYEYALTTPWLLSGGVTFTTSFSVNPEDSSPRGLFFKPDGLAVFITGVTSNNVYKYPLSIAFDISSIEPTVANFNVASEDSSASGLFFSPDGVKMFIMGSATDTIYEYPLLLPWDISTNVWIPAANGFTPADRIKLDGIEALADVTGTINVTAAGALMDSEVTNLSGIKTLTVPDSTTISAFGATLIDDVDQATAQTTLGVDPAGTDNSIDVTLVGTPDYITIVGQVITRGQVVLTTDVTGVLPIANGGTNAITASAARTSLGLVIGTDVQAHSAVLDATTASFLIADETKLDGIEALANVTDAANVAAAGAVMESDATTALMTFVIDEDTMASDLATKVPTQQSVKAYVDTEVAAAITSEMSYKGSYDAATNTPNLDATPVAIAIGDMYTVTVAGTFFTIPVEIGDVLIAEVDSATLESQWTIVNKNLDAASIKTSYESNTNTNAFTDTEQTKVSNLSGTNTGDITLAGAPNYLTLAGQVLTLTKLDITDDTNLIAGTGITLATNTLNVDAAQSGITSLGTLTTLDVDNIRIDGNTISSIAGVDLFITPLGGQRLMLDTLISVDNGVILGATSITSTAFVGALTGNADTVTTNANLTGDVTSSGSNATTIAVDAVDIAMLSATGTPDGTTFLRGDNTWSVAGIGDMVLASVQTITGAKTFNTGTFLLDGATSGQITINAAAIAGTGTWTVPLTATTDTFVGKDTTDTLTNKTIDANAGGNSITNINVADTNLIAGTGITLATNTLNVDAAQSGITSVGTLTTLDVDNIRIDGNTISSIAGVDLFITPLGGQRLMLDTLISVDNGVILGATSITSTTFVGALTGNADTVTTNANLTGDVTSSGSNATTIAVDAVDIAMLSATGTPGGTTFLRGDNTWSVPAGAGDMVLADVQTITGAKTFNTGTFLLDGATSGQITINAAAIAGTGTWTVPLTATTDTFVGKATTDTLTNKTINANAGGNSITNINVADTNLIAGTGITLTTNTLNVDAAQSGITSVGTLTTLDVDNIRIDGNTISSIAGVDLFITPLGGQRLMLDTLISVDNGVILGATSITSTAFVGALTGNADTVTTNANLTGDVTSSGSNATTIAVDAVDIAMLSATGAAGGTTFLRGDNTWAVPAGTGGDPNFVSESAPGTAPVAVGTDSIAIGDNAVSGDAAGDLGTIAIGARSTATGINAVAIGENADATGLHSIAIGGHTIDGSSADAAGNGGMAIGKASYSGGYATALGYYASAGVGFATAIGAQTNASQGATVAIGRFAAASAVYAIAIGGGGTAPAAAIASGTDAVAIGGETDAIGNQSVAIGESAQAGNAVGDTGAIAIGRSASSLNYGGVAIGWDSIATGNSTVVIGQNASATATDSIAIGGATTIAGAAHATVTYSIAIGRLTDAIGSFGIAIGSNAQAGDAAGDVSAIAIGTSSISSDVASIAIGGDAVATSLESIAIGRYTDAVGTQSVAIGGGSSDAVSANTSGNDSVAIGRGAATAAASAVAIGDDAKAGDAGGDTAAIAIGRGADSLAIASVAIGDTALSSNADSIAIGRLTDATGVSAIAIGGSSVDADSANASGTYAIAIGVLSDATANSSVAIGNSSQAIRIGEHARSSGAFTVAGDAQFSRFVCRTQTTSATPVVMNPDGGVVNRLLLPDTSMWVYEVLLAARQTGGAGGAVGDCFVAKYEGVIDRDGVVGNTALVGTILTTNIATVGLTASSLAITADVTLGGLQLQVTGEATKNINWVATVSMTQVIG